MSNRRLIYFSAAIGALLVLCKLVDFTQVARGDSVAVAKHDGASLLVMYMPEEGKLFLKKNISGRTTDVHALSAYLEWLHLKREFLLDKIKDQRRVNGVGELHSLLASKALIRKRMRDFCYTEAALMDSLAGTDGTTSLDRDALGLEILLCKCSISIIAQQLIKDEEVRLNWIAAWAGFDRGLLEKNGYSLGVGVHGDLFQVHK